VDCNELIARDDTESIPAAFERAKQVGVLVRRGGGDHLPVHQHDVERLEVVRGVALGWAEEGYPPAQEESGADISVVLLG
jgi:hypothetical protein